MKQISDLLPPGQFLKAPPFRLLLRMASPNALAFLVQASVSMAEAWLKHG